MAVASQKVIVDEQLAVLCQMAPVVSHKIVDTW